MHRLFLGCNLWNALFLTLAGALGLAGSPLHARVGVFATVFCCLVQSGAIALFLGAAKLTKEHVGRFDMPLDLIDRLNGVYHRLFPMAAFGAVIPAAAAVLGGAAGAGGLPVWAHAAPAALSWAYLLAIIPLEYRLQARLHAIIGEVERRLPPPERAAETAPRPGYTPDQVVLDRAGRARALLYVGLTLPLPWLGYTFISGRDVSFLIVPTVLATAVCLGAAAHQYLGLRR